MFMMFMNCSERGEGWLTVLTRWWLAGGLSVSAQPTIWPGDRGRFSSWKNW